jgi:hypothetical protein
LKDPGHPGDGGAGHTGRAVHCRLLLESGVQSLTVAPLVEIPPLSSAVFVPRLMIW